MAFAGVLTDFANRQVGKRRRRETERDRERKKKGKKRRTGQIVTPVPYSLSTLSTIRYTLYLNVPGSLAKPLTRWKLVGAGIFLVVPQQARRIAPSTY